MLYSFLIILREGFEIALVLAIVLGYLKRTGNSSRFPAVWAGAGAAAGLCLVAGGLLELTATHLSGSAQEAFEGATMLIAVVVLTWMVFWMRKQAASIGRELRGKIDVALESGSVAALVALAFIAVLREGLETVLLLFAGASASNGGTASFLAGAVLGGAVAAVLGYLVYRGSHVLPVRQFFVITGLIVIVIAAGLLSNGIAELQESGLIGNLGSRPWDTDAYLSLTTTLGKFLHTLVGYDSSPTWGQIVLYWGYLIASVGTFVLGFAAWNNKPTASRLAPPAQQEAK